jgi:ATP-binding cassette subfamily C (CFTR/MRP) protein 1
VVGRTGSGKSSLIKLFWRYLDLTEGEILIDGVDITKQDLKQLRNSLTIITQDVVVLDGSLSDSIDPTRKYLRTDAEKERMMNILAELGFTNQDFIKNGLDMKVNEGGSNLSQGEKQLICFARALCKKNKLVLFDEATASIDIKTEERFQVIMEREFADSTIFIIAHRIQTIKKCDKVMVLD